MTVLADRLAGRAKVAAARSSDLTASMRWAIFILAWLGLTLVSAAQPTQSPISCQWHRGAFSNAFSPAFDINSLDCRMSGIKDSPTVRFWSVYPFVGIKWHR